MEESVKEKKPRKKQFPKSENNGKRNSPIIPQDVLKHATPEEMAVIVPVVAQYSLIKGILAQKDIEQQVLFIIEKDKELREDLANLTGPLYARRQMSK